MNYIGVGKLIEKEIRRFLVVWVQTLLGPIISGMLYLLIFVVLLRKQQLAADGIDYVTFLAPGLVMMTMLQNSFANSSSSILIGKVSRSIEDILMAPFRPWEVVFGYLSGAVVRGLLSGILLWLALMPFVDLSIITTPSIASAGLVLLYALGGTAIFSLFGILAGAGAKRMEHIAFLSQIVVAPLTILSGTFYSLSQVPEPARAAIELNPVYYLIDGFRRALLTGAPENVWAGLSIIVIASGGLFLASCLIWRSGLGLKS